MLLFSHCNSYILYSISLKLFIYLFCSLSQPKMSIFLSPK